MRMLGGGEGEEAIAKFFARLLLLSRGSPNSKYTDDSDS